MSKIRIGIVGYGNLGRGVEASVKLQPDMELVGVFSRRKGLETVSGVPTYTMEDLPNFKGKIDVMVLCGGSATDLIEQTPMVTKYFNCIDSFDTHARIPEHFANVDKVAKEAKTATLISCGWDPGMFSLQRVYAESILPHGKSYTFRGRGVSQGHSDAIRRIDGVLDFVFNFCFVCIRSSYYIAFTKVTFVAINVWSFTITDSFKVLFFRNSVLTSIKNTINTTDSIGVTLGNAAAPECVRFAVRQDAFSVNTL